MRIYNTQPLLLLQSGMLGGDLLIEPVIDVAIPEDGEEEKREVTRLHHVVYKVKKQNEETSVSDFGKHLAAYPK